MAESFPRRPLPWLAPEHQAAARIRVEAAAAARIAEWHNRLEQMRLRGFKPVRGSVFNRDDLIVWVPA